MKSFKYGMTAFLSALFVSAQLSSCEKGHEDPDTSYDTQKPVIGAIEISPTDGFTLGSTVTIRTSVSDNESLATVSVIMTDITGSIVDSRIFEPKGQELDIQEELFISYLPVSPEGRYEISIRAEDVKGNLAEKSLPIEVSTPAFDQLYLVIEGEESTVIMKKNADNPVLFETETDLPQGARIKIASQSNGSGIVWGCKEAKQMAVGAEDFTDLQLSDAAQGYRIGFSIADFRLQLPKIKVASYYVVGPAINPNWTVLGPEITGYSESGKSTWSATNIALEQGEFKLVKSTGGNIDWTSGIGYDDGALTVSDASTPLYVKDAGTYDITVEYDEATASFTLLSIVNNLHETVYSSSEGIRVDGEQKAAIELSGSLLPAPTSIEYPYWFKPSEIFTFNDGATLTVSDAMPLDGLTADERFFQVEGNTITYVGPSGQRWTLGLNLAEGSVEMLSPDRTMTIPDALWMTGANFCDAASIGSYLVWDTHVILKRVSETCYECQIAIQNMNTSAPALLRIVGADGAAGWGLDNYQPANFATPYPEGITDGGGGNFQCVDYGGIYTLTVDLAGGDGNYTMTFVKTGVLP